MYQNFFQHNFLLRGEKSPQQVFEEIGHARDLCFVLDSANSSSPGRIWVFADNENSDGIRLSALLRHWKIDLALLSQIFISKVPGDDLAHIRYYRAPEGLRTHQPTAPSYDELGRCGMHTDEAWERLLHFRELAGKKITIYWRDNEVADQVQCIPFRSYAQGS